MFARVIIAFVMAVFVAVFARVTIIGVVAFLIVVVAMAVLTVVTFFIVIVRITIFLMVFFAVSIGLCTEIDIGGLWRSGVGCIRTACKRCCRQACNQHQDAR